jgi:outer membrane protein TolC
MTHRLATLIAGSFLVIAPLRAHAQTTPPAPAQATLDLTMDAAVKMALEANLGLQAGRLNLDGADHAIASARAAFLPQVGSTLSRSSQVSVPNDFTQGSADITSRGLTVNSSFNHVLPTFGTTYALTWNNNRTSQTGGNPLFNPFLRSAFSLSLSQPLWRGLVTDQARTALTTSHRRRRVADLQFEQQVVRLEAAVRVAYLDLISAREGLRVAQQNMQIRQASLADARARVNVGAAAPIDLISAEAEVAANQEQVLVAEALIGTREDQLRTLILDPERADYWQVRINAIDAVQSQPREIDVDGAIRNALDNRLDLIAARQDIEINDLSLRVARDATRPAVNLQLNYATSGTGGTRFIYGQGFPPPVEGRTDRSYNSVLGDTFGAAYPQWSVGLNVAYPLGRSAADANLAQQEVARRQSQISLRELELAVVQQVRDVARQVQSSYQRVVVTRAALAASEQQLDAEQRRFAAGLSTTLELQVRQGQLATARTAELNAVIAYNRALIDFERLQKTQ